MNKFSFKHFLHLSTLPDKSLKDQKWVFRHNKEQNKILEQFVKDQFCFDSCNLCKFSIQNQLFGKLVSYPISNKNNKNSLFIKKKIFFSDQSSGHDN